MIAQNAQRAFVLEICNKGDTNQKQINNCLVLNGNDMSYNEFVKLLKYEHVHEGQVIHNL